MKAYKISFFISLLLLLWSISYCPKINVAEQSQINNIQQSPLSDDQTDPINKNVFEYADIDLEENNENNFLSSNFNILPVISSDYFLHAFNSNLISFSTNKYPQLFSHRLLHSSQSYLSVFRI